MTFGAHSVGLIPRKVTYIGRMLTLNSKTKLYSIRVSPPFFRRVEDDFNKRSQLDLPTKSAMAYLGNNKVDLGMIHVNCNDDMIYGDIYLIYRCRLKDIDSDDLECMGMDYSDDLVKAYQKKRSKVNRETEITVIRFRVIKIEYYESRN
jgi:hypothetical protein